jgi:phage baseplate assembly protein W
MALKPSREIAFPFHIGPDGGIAYVEDTYRTAFQHLIVTLLTTPGERVMVPGFGTPVRDYLFENVDDVVGVELSILVRDAISAWEPGIVLHEVNPRTTSWEEGVLELEILFSVPPRQDVLSTVVDVGGAIGGGDLSG